MVHTEVHFGLERCGVVESKRNFDVCCRRKTKLKVRIMVRSRRALVFLGDKCSSVRARVLECVLTLHSYKRRRSPRDPFAELCLLLQVAETSTSISETFSKRLLNRDTPGILLHESCQIFTDIDLELNV